MEQNNNPLLLDVSGKLGSIMVALPTRGLFYKETTLAKDADPSAIEVLPVSVVDELNFRDPFKIINGYAIKEMISRCCPKILDVNDLCKVDVDLILIAARAASHGSTMELNVKCQNQFAVKKNSAGDEEISSCEEQSEIKINLDQIMLQYVSVGDQKEWQLTLPNKQIVQLMPLPYSAVVKGMIEVANQAKNARRLELEKKENDIDALTEYQEKAMDNSAKLQIKLLIDSISFVITSTGKKIYDKIMIAEWILALPGAWIMQLNDVLNKKADFADKFGIVKYKCPSCNSVQEVPINMDPTSFFSTGSRKRTR
jgi:hypothetical protein